MQPVRWIDYRENNLKQSIDTICDLLFYLPLKKFEEDYTKIEMLELIKLLQLLSNFFQLDKEFIFKEELSYLHTLVKQELKFPDEMIDLNGYSFILSRNGFIWKLLHPTKINNSGGFETVAIISNLGVGIQEDSAKLAFEIISEFRGKKIMKLFLKQYLNENKKYPGMFEALISVENEASIALVQSVGFDLYSQRQGTLCFRYQGSGS